MSRRSFAREHRGFFAIGICGNKTPDNLGTLWRHATLYGAAFVFTVGKRYPHAQPSDTTKTANHTPLFHFANVDDLIEHLPHSCPLVGVELTEASVPLSRYRHQMRGAYLLGAEDRGLTKDQLARCHELVQIESAQPWSMNVAVAGTLVMYDRHLKANATSRAIGVAS
jgi:tRNA G18 (ribose-2'-O)-methylase SpoU